MSEGVRRSVTRGYAGALTAAAVIVAVALVVAVWGLLSLALGRDPVSSDGVPVWAAPLILAVLLGVLAWGVWRQAIVLLRGRRAPAWGIVVSLAGGAYLLWCLGGVLAGLSVEETWTSPFAAVLAPIWALASLLFWAVLARRVYTDRPPPRWPWERDEEDG
ncbi:hypothetical protein [Leucobacter ruminantium]|uniref:Transmembrane protein n=1 Tax=Leucobacter ruminantium TaxID=1289170 RepID=A0A939LTH6_9MICO|nr:hypothetical protein [Leucobacter ruminantium]MBO1804071.1 hypothetical protein [Leucobacter ruminantium]